MCHFIFTNSVELIFPLHGVPLVQARVLEGSRAHVEEVEQRQASKETLTNELAQDDNVVEDVKEKERAEEQEDVEKKKEQGGVTHAEEVAQRLASKDRHTYI
ncbi:C5a peptidase [Striga asiatica]|uniref:C5a peptidase n=1 Tax=Striga asiatica TaxID=4170 RepID=A0A5A7PM52_STRAF|nr:C5a peptidase [Striga asiatica]